MTLRTTSETQQELGVRGVAWHRERSQSKFILSFQMKGRRREGKEGGGGSEEGFKERRKEEKKKGRRGSIMSKLVSLQNIKQKFMNHFS